MIGNNERLTISVVIAVPVSCLYNTICAAVSKLPSDTARQCSSSALTVPGNISRNKHSCSSVSSEDSDVLYKKKQANLVNLCPRLLFLFSYLNYHKVSPNSYFHLFSEGIKHKGKN